MALEPHELPWLDEAAELMRGYGHEVELLDGEQMRAEVRSPTYLGGLWDRTGAAMVHPGKLARGLRAAALAAGVRLFEHSAVEDTRARRRRRGAGHRRRSGHARAARCSPPAPTPRSCARSAATCCRSTTTR